MRDYVDIPTLRFLLNKVHGLEEVLSLPKYKEYDIEAIDMLLDAVKEFADKEMLPFFKEMDENQAHFKEGEIIVHPQVLKYMKEGGEMGFISNGFDHAHGGMQMPSMVTNASFFIQEAANNHLPGYMGLTIGAAELIVHFANEELNQKFVPKMLTGQWGGTMCLTEPQAGSSLSDIITTAKPASGHYKIYGQKIFISAGDYKGVENIVHLVLARIEGAPAGTKGISLFVVPKNRITHEGLQPNDVTTVADFQKMGQKGYCTTHLFFGDQEDCEGYLVGEPNKGLQYMFMMMNGARIAVGRGAAAIATAAYHASLQYAKERPQGRPISTEGDKDVSQGQTLIINHPDVRRMLLLQKSITEGALSLVLLTSKYHDLASAAIQQEDRNKYHLLLELLTPIVKTYPSEAGQVSVNNGLQVLGGYGFCTDYILQQYHRDIRISAIYEGTTGIQSLDLLGRKIPMQNGKALELLTIEITKTIKEAMGFEALKPEAKKLAAVLVTLQKVLETLTPFAKRGDFQRYLSDASPFLELFSIGVIAWQWLHIGLQAQTELVNGAASQEDFLESKILTMKFYYRYEVPRINALAETLNDNQALTLPKGMTLWT